MSVDTKTFIKILEEGKAPTKAPKRGKADWDAIYEELIKVEIPMTTTQIWERLAKKVVSRYRTREKLHEWHDLGKCKRIYLGNKYHWLSIGSFN